MRAGAVGEVSSRSYARKRFAISGFQLSIQPVNRADSPVIRELVLLGGGHSHVAVLKMFRMNPVPGTRLTLISKDNVAPYSGMLPGLIAGHYSFDEAHIDLRRLCRFANAQFYRAEISGLDLSNKRVLCKGRPPVTFDLLSINVGSVPRSHDIPGAAKYTLPVKPVDRFIARWPELIEQIKTTGAPLVRIAVVGGGAGGVELTLSAQFQLQAALHNVAHAPAVEFHLVTETATLLPTHNRRVQQKFNRILQERGVRVYVNHRVTRVQPDCLYCEPGAAVPFDFAFWVTTASAPGWIAQSGLETDPAGFLAVNESLQSKSHPFVFGAGDVAAVLKHPRPKSGVFAVRQGAPLARNLRRALTDQALENFAPQRQFLSLISTGNKYAVASRGPFACEGEWVWRWKDWIDRKWMRQYQELPFMASTSSPAAPETNAALDQLRGEVMRCGGCGAKVGSVVLTRVLQRLKPPAREDVLIGLDTPDDAAVTIVPPGKVSVQTVDFFRSLINDPFTFGKIAANHSLNDIYAMGAEPRSALAMAMLPFAAEHVLEEQLFQLLSGAIQVLEENDVALAGGHTAEGAELAFGLVVNGIADPGKLLRKSGMRPGDKLILTKPLGTGTIFAAEMRHAARSTWIDAALQSMLLSNRDAASIIQRHGATACTDVTGFGLIGHAVEMAQASNVSLQIRLADLPLIDGTLDCVQAGMLSSLYPDNLRSKRAISNLDAMAKTDRFPLLFDPQTAGGLLATLPEQNAPACLGELQAQGYAQARIIGSVLPKSSEFPITLAL
jgi:selenide,water dikinase